MPKTAIAVNTPLPSPAAPIAAGPSGPTMIVSTMPITIQPISARITGPASLSRGGSSRSTWDRPVEHAECHSEQQSVRKVCRRPRRAAVPGGDAEADRVARTRVAAREGRAVARTRQVDRPSRADAPGADRDGVRESSALRARAGRLRRSAVRAGRLDGERIDAVGAGRARHVCRAPTHEPGTVPNPDTGAAREGVHAS